MKNNRVFWPLVSCIILAIGVIVCRYALFSLHGMGSYPWMLAVLGLLVIIVAAVRDARKLMLCTSVGYSVGFALAMLLQSDGVDPGGGTTNNAWIIWGAAFIITIIVGTVLQLVGRKGNP